MKDLISFIDQVTQNSLCDMHRNRLYNGQLHTYKGLRGQQIVSGITIRDLSDCLLRSFFLCSGHINSDKYTEACKGEEAKLCENDLYGWDLDKIDPVALIQNFTCEVEKIMGIFPNLSKIKSEIPCIDLDTGKITTENL